METLMRMRKRSALALALSAGVLSGCLDLDVVSNQGAPTAEQVLTEPAEIQLVVAGTWSTLWNYLENNTSSHYAMGAMGHEWTSGNATLIQYTQLEPRTQYPNDYSLNNRFVSQNPWYAIYEGIDNATQTLRQMEGRGVRLMLLEEGDSIATDKTDRARAFAYYTQGALYGIIALTYDQASVSLHTTDKSDPDWWAYKPYTEIAQVAIAQLEKSVQVAQAAPPFVIPGTWTGGTPIDNALLVRMAHYQMARIKAYLPRTPAERRDVSQGGIVNWAQVIAHTNQAITQDFLVTLITGGRVSDYTRYMNSQGTMVTDPRVYGPADASGNYAEWQAKPVSERNKFLVSTYDRRITNRNADGTPNPTSSGTYFRYVATCCGATWQSYQTGFYVWQRNGNPVRWNTGNKVHMALDEMNLIRAEGFLRTGQAEQALPLINRTRVANGQLPPVTLDGVPGTLQTCAPRNYAGTACGTLLDALHHERVIELYGLNNYRAWWDRRGFGTLSVGTYTQLPVPVRELQALGTPFYTTGGTQGSSADGVLQVR
jgi:hypothetical protein